MPTHIQGQNEKPGFFARFKRFIELVEKTEEDYLWDNIKFLKGRIDVLEAELRDVKSAISRE